MAIGVFSGSIFAWPEATRGASSRALRFAAVAGFAVGAGTLVALALPSSAYRTKAVVAVADISSPFAAMLPRAVADVSMSEPVMRRAASSLVGGNVAVPAPDVFERIAVAVGLEGAHATGRVARLASELARSATAAPGELPGSLEISAGSPDPEDASRIATAIAEALISDHDDTSAQARGRREADALSRLERVKAEAEAARRRLADLGGIEADPTQMRAAAATQTANAQARVDAIHAILASGTPPMSDRRDVPPAIEALQTSYLDLSRQLAKARETLGDRHTTIIALQAEARQAAASLTAEWRRLERLANADLAAARQRESMLRKAGTAVDASRRETINEARRNVQLADDNVARAQSAQEMPEEERSYRLLARAAVPTATVGVSPVTRALIATAAGLAALALALRLPALPSALLMLRRYARRPRDEAVEMPDEPIAPAKGTEADIGHAMKKREKIMRAPREATIEPGLDLERSLSHLLSELESIEPEYGDVPTVMVAGNDTSAATMPVALALGHVVAAAGYRALVVEVARSHPELAAAADPKADPAVVDLFGTLRVILLAEGCDGVLFLAPSIEQGARIASALARQEDTPLIDDIAADFDLIVIDGGCGPDSAAAGWAADAYVRVGRFASAREDERFAATFGVAASALLGTVVASSFAPKTQHQPRKPSGGALPTPSSTKAPTQNFIPSPRSAYTRSGALRRRAGAR